MIWNRIDRGRELDFGRSPSRYLHSCFHLRSLQLQAKKASRSRLSACETEYDEGNTSLKDLFKHRSCLKMGVVIDFMVLSSINAHLGLSKRDLPKEDLLFPSRPLLFLTEPLAELLATLNDPRRHSRYCRLMARARRHGLKWFVDRTQIWQPDFPEEMDLPSQLLKQLTGLACDRSGRQYFQGQGKEAVIFGENVRIENILRFSLFTTRPDLFLNPGRQRYGLRNDNPWN